MIQRFVARRAERPGEVHLLKRSDVVLRRMQDCGLSLLPQMLQGTLSRNRSDTSAKYNGVHEEAGFRRPLSDPNRVGHHEHVKARV
jgi:hypothetical protein